MQVNIQISLLMLQSRLVKEYKMDLDYTKAIEKLHSQEIFHIDLSLSIYLLKQPVHLRQAVK